MGGELLESLASFEAAFADLAKRVEDSAWQLTDAEVLELSRRVAAVNSKAAGLQMRVIREIDTRGVHDSAGATSLRNFVAGSLRLSPAEAGRWTRLAASLHGGCTATATALADGW